MFLLVVWITLGNMEYGTGDSLGHWVNNANEHEHRQDSMEETFIFNLHNIIVFQISS